MVFGDICTAYVPKYKSLQINNKKAKYVTYH